MLKFLDCANNELALYDANIGHSRRPYAGFKQRLCGGFHPGRRIGEAETLWGRAIRPHNAANRVDIPRMLTVAFRLFLSGSYLEITLYGHL